MDVDFGVWSAIEDGLQVVDNLEGEMLSWSWVGFYASSYGCLVVDKYPDGIGAGIRLYPVSGKYCCLQDSKQLGVVNFNMFSKVPSSLRVGVLGMNCNQTSTIRSGSSL